MVRVPLPQEALQGGGLPAFRAPSVVPQQDFTGTQLQQLGRAATVAGTATANIADVLQDDLDTAKSKEAMTRWLDENRVILQDPVDGYLNKQGKDATGAARVNAQNRIAKNAETFSQGLDNDQQRAMFEIAVQEKTLQISATMDQHEARAIQVFNIGETKALSEELATDSVEFATLTVPNTVEFLKNKEASMKEAGKVAAMLGYGPEQTEAFLLDNSTAIHSGVINELLSQKRTGEALQYWEDVDKDEIERTQRIKLRNVLDGAKLGNDATRKAIELTTKIDQDLMQNPPAQQDPNLIGPLPPGAVRTQGAEVFGPPAPGTDPMAANEDQFLLRAFNDLNAQFLEGTITDDERIAIFDRMTETAKVRKGARISATNNAMGQAENWLIDNDLASVSSMRETLPQIYETIREAGMLGQLNAFADSNRRYTTDPMVYAQVLEIPRAQLRSMSDAEFHMRFRGSANDRDLARLKAHHQAVRGGLKGPTVFTNVERVNEIAIAHGIKERGTDDPLELLRFARFDRELQRRVTGAASRGEPTDDEALQRLGELVATDIVMLKDSFILDAFAADDPVLLATLSDEEKRLAFIRLDVGDIRVGKIPKEVRGEIIFQLRENGKPVTEFNIIDAWADTGGATSVEELKRIEEQQVAGGLTIDMRRQLAVERIRGLRFQEDIEADRRERAERQRRLEITAGPLGGGRGPGGFTNLILGTGGIDILTRSPEELLEGR